jgi:hypothetical protein
VIAAPRQVAPLSTTTVTSQTPRLRWELRPGTDGARIELCRERACATVVHRFDAAGATAVAPMTLTPGVWFWRASGMRAGEAGTSASATWQFVVGHRSATVNTAWGTSVDFNGDGDADLAFAVGGTVYVYYGTGSGLAASAATFRPSSVGYVAALSGVGCDVNGDGFGDLVVTSTGAPGTTTYTATIYLGGASGLGATPLRSFDPVVASARLVGDVNGDGYGDLALDDFLALGAPGGPVDGRMSFTSPAAPRSYFPAGDVNGDGFGDVMECARSATNRLRYDCVARVGGATGLGAAFGASVDVIGGVRLAGDADGDGRADGAMSQVDGSALRRAVYFGGAFGPSVLEVPGASLNFALGDVNGDGFYDLLGFESSPDGTTFTASNVLLGSVSRTWGTQRRVTTFAGEPLPASIGWIGDTDRDEGSEFVAGDRSASAVYLFRSIDVLSTGRPSRAISTSPDSIGDGITMNVPW